MNAFETELQHRIQKADKKARFEGAGLIAGAIFFFVIGYFSNSPSQREFTRSMGSGRTIIDPVIDKVPPLKAGRDASTGLMLLMPFVMMGLGVFCLGFGGYRLTNGLTDKEKQKVGEDYRDELEEKRIQEYTKAMKEGSIAAAESQKPDLLFDGIYTTTYYFSKGSLTIHLRFYPDGRVAVLETGLSPIRVYMQFKKHDAPEKVPDVVLGKYSILTAESGAPLSAAVVSFSTTRRIGDYVDSRTYSGGVELNKLRVKIQRGGSDFCPVNDWNFTEIAPGA